MQDTDHGHERARVERHQATGHEQSYHEWKFKQREHYLPLPNTGWVGCGQNL